MGKPRLTTLQEPGSIVAASFCSSATSRSVWPSRRGRLNSGLQQLQRQEATAQLTAGIAHDFNNLLSAINGSATLIGLEENLTDGLTAHVDRISSAGNQAARLVNRLLDIGAQGDGKGAFDLGSALVDIPELLLPSLPENITFEVSGPDEQVTLKGDVGDLSQVIVNLALNARDAIAPHVGTITLSADRIRDRSTATIQEGELLSSEHYVRIDVSDTGSGISADNLDRIFQPYVSTKGHKGTGLGLAMVSIQTQNVGGAVGNRSSEGEGTTVSIFWPIASAGTRADTDVSSSAHDLSGQTIIVVDDDGDVATVAANYLEAQGAEVAISIDPQDALEAVRDDPDAWSAVITDYDMPQMTGGDLAEKVREASPTMPIILVTALARRLSDPRINDGTIDAVLPKPTDLNQLSSLIFEYRHARSDG